jgi:hypothetical protein
MFIRIEATKKLAQLALTGLVLATGAVATQVSIPTPAMARGGGGGGGGDGGGGGGEGTPAGVFFREERALFRALKARARHPGRGRPDVRVVRPYQDHDCDFVVFKETPAGPRYRCKIIYSRY